MLGASIRVTQDVHNVHSYIHHSLDEDRTEPEEAGLTSAPEGSGSLAKLQPPHRLLL